MTKIHAKKQKTKSPRSAHLRANVTQRAVMLALEQGEDVADSQAAEWAGWLGAQLDALARELGDSLTVQGPLRDIFADMHLLRVRMLSAEARLPFSSAVEADR